VAEPAVVQSVTGFGAPPLTLTLPGAPIEGNTLVIVGMLRTSDAEPTFPAGFDVIASRTNPDDSPSNMRWTGIARKVVEAGDGAAYQVAHAATDGAFLLVEMTNLGAFTLDGQGDWENFDATIEWPNATGTDAGEERTFFLIAGGDQGGGNRLPPEATPLAAPMLYSTREVYVGYRWVQSTAPPYTYTVGGIGGWQLGTHVSVAHVATAQPAFFSRFW
jgi:hypothetical protein